MKTQPITPEALAVIRYHESLGEEGRAKLPKACADDEVFMQLLRDKGFGHLVVERKDYGINDSQNRIKFN